MAVFDLAKNGGLADILRSGWSKPESGMVWSDGYYSSLQVSVPPGQEDLILKMKAMPYLNRGVVDKQRVEIFCWGVASGFFVLSGPEVVDVKAVIPAYVRNFGFLKIDIRWPDAESPSRNGSSDKRILAVALHSLEVIASKS
jgi:hypothetical protein